jgi:hypothetical protein
MEKAALKKAVSKHYSWWRINIYNSIYGNLYLSYIHKYIDTYEYDIIPKIDRIFAYTVNYYVYNMKTYNGDIPYLILSGINRFVAKKLENSNLLSVLCQFYNDYKWNLRGGYLMFLMKSNKKIDKYTLRHIIEYI